MGELTRRRRARDLQVSRSHLWAGAIAAVLLIVIAFALGRGLSTPGTSPAAAAVEADEDQESLVDLLARIEEARGDGVETLTFPDTLTGVGEDPALPPEPRLPSDVSVVAGGDVGERPFELVLTVEDEDAARLLRTELSGRGWQTALAIGEDHAVVTLGTAANLEQATADLERLQVDLAELERDVEPRLVPLD